MRNKIALLISTLISITMTAQIKGVVKDSLSGVTVPFVNISVENENIGTTSEEDGSFVIHQTEEHKNLIFSALGYEKKKVNASKSQVVFLKPTAYELNEVMIDDRKNTSAVEIGATKNSIYQAFDNGPRIDTKFFPYSPEYKKTKYIKAVTVETDSKIEAALIKLHFYKVDANGYPGEELMTKDFLVTVKKGISKNRFDLSNFNLKIPTKGLFVGFEKLIIEKNKYEKTTTDFNTNKKQTVTSYAPLVLYNYVERDYLYMYSGGKWTRQTHQEEGSTIHKIMVYEPAINLILTN